MTVEKLVFFDRNLPEYDESPTPAEKCVTGQPLQRTWHHFTNADGKLFAGVWEAEPGRWRVDYSEDEFCRILSGHSVLHDSEGGQRHLRPGDNFVIPSGFRGEWEVVETTRKIYVIYQA